MKKISRSPKRRFSNGTASPNYEHLENRRMFASDSPQWIYYLENNVISRSLPDGTNQTALVESSEAGWAITNFDLDTVSNRIFYAEQNGITNSRIKSVDMLGQNPVLISEGAAGKGNYSMAVDGVNRYVYLHSHDVPPLSPSGPFFEGRIQKISYQGVLTLLPPVLWYVHDMEVNADTDTLYYTNDVNSTGLFKSDLNGLNSTNLVNDSGVMRNIAISRLRGKLIYTNAGETPNKSGIYIMNPDGSDKVKLGEYTGAGIDDVELDDEAGIIYFATTLDGIFKTSISNFSPIQVMPGRKTELEIYNSPNVPPTLDSLSDLIIEEDAGMQTVNLSGITAGGNENQQLRVTATNSNTTLIPSVSVNYSSPNSVGTLQFTCSPNLSGNATFSVTVEDGGKDGNLETPSDNLTFSRSFEVTVNPVNDAPKLTNVGADITYRENVVIARICNAVRLQDVDTSVFANGTLRVAIESGESDDRLWLMNSQYLTVNGNQLVFNGLIVGTYTGGTGGQPLQVSFNNRASTNRVQHVMRCVCFAHDSDNPQAAQRTVSIQLTDGSGGMVTASKQVNVIPVNDRPTLSGIPASSTYTLNTNSILIAPSAIVTDPDNANFAGGQLNVRYYGGQDASNRLLATGLFSFDATNNLLRNGTVVGQRNASGGIGENNLVITFNSNATKEIFQEFLRCLSFQTVGGTSKASRYLEFSLTDGKGGTSNLVSTRIDLA